MDNIEFLPKHLRESCVKIGNEIGWRWSDIRDVITHACKNAIGVAVLQVQMNLPIGTCDYYWVCYVSDSKNFTGTWNEFCEKSMDDACRWLDTITDDFLEQEARSGFNLRCDRQTILDCTRILTYFITKEEFDSK